MRFVPVPAGVPGSASQRARHVPSQKSNCFHAGPAHGTGGAAGASAQTGALATASAMQALRHGIRRAGPAFQKVHLSLIHI